MSGAVRPDIHSYNITGVIVIDLIINLQQLWSCKVQCHGREFDGILPNIRVWIDSAYPKRSYNVQVLSWHTNKPLGDQANILHGHK